MAIDYKPEQNEYTNLTPFKAWLVNQINTWGINNFPFLEGDFDKLTNYGMLMKMMKCLNDIISNENKVEDDMTNLFNAFTELQTYVNNYFDNLDVQDEINIKLDEMAQDGTLTGLISTYLIPIINEQNRQIQNIDNKVDAVASGSPIPVSSISDMTNTSKVYVLTTDGYWYYYNATTSEWTQGGIYQSSQSTDDVETTKSILESVYNVTGIKGDVVEYENKTINTSTGVINNSTTRILTKDYLPNNLTKILINTNYEIVLVVFDSTNTFKGIYRTGTHTVEPTTGLTWTTNELVIPYDLILATDKLKILMKNKSGSQVAITPEEASYLSYDYKLLSVLNDNDEIINNLNNLYNTSGGTLIEYDEDFNHNNPINIYKVNNNYTTNFDYTDNKINITNSVYIDPDGDDVNGNGTKDNPYKTLEQALSDNTVNTIYLNPGTYYMGENFTNGLVINKEINLIGNNSCLFFGDKDTNTLTTTGILRIRENVYCENIIFNGGRGLIVEVETDTPTFYNCKFINSNQNGLNFRGLGCYIINCEASFNQLDGFNYHSYNNVLPTGIVEINSIAHHNGNKSNRSSNGSTIHEHGCIIRLKNEYYLNHGGNLADSESMSYNFDIISHDSTNYHPNDIIYNANYNSLTNSKIWLYNCLGSGSIYQLSASSGSVINSDSRVLPNTEYKDSTSQINYI